MSFCIIYNGACLILCSRMCTHLIFARYLDSKLFSLLIWVYTHNLKLNIQCSLYWRHQKLAKQLQQPPPHNKLGMVWKKVRRDVLDAIYKYLLFTCLMQQRKCWSMQKNIMGCPFRLYHHHTSTYHSIFQSREGIIDWHTLEQNTRNWLWQPKSSKRGKRRWKRETSQEGKPWKVCIGAWTVNFLLD